VVGPELGDPSRKHEIDGPQERGWAARSDWHRAAALYDLHREL
jgi:hypothetical protein